MQTSRYLIVGGGLTGDAACKGIRAVDTAGAITVVSEEWHPPYARPPLSKGLWKGDAEGLHQLCECVGDLLAETLLHGEATRKHP
jgi:NADPH-dependent 2,4-dienoyl-CoA reductase/sulfur reductase-like enzyme